MLLKSDIKKIWELQREVAENAELGIPREVLTDFPAPAKHAIILTGIRRCGKSTLL